jgi:NADPH2:quinone reductase
VFWGDFVRREPQAFQRDLQQLATWYAEGKVTPVMDQTLPLSDLHAAYARMAARQVVGKLVLLQP